MGKITTYARRKTTSRRPKKTLKKEPVLKLDDFEGIKKHDPNEYLTNNENLGNAIVECLENNDPDGVVEVILIYLEALNKTKFSTKSELSRQTLYSALKHKNPTIKTLAKIMHASAQGK